VNRTPTGRCCRWSRGTSARGAPDMEALFAEAFAAARVRGRAQSPRSGARRFGLNPPACRLSIDASCPLNVTATQDDLQVLRTSGMRGARAAPARRDNLVVLMLASDRRNVRGVQHGERLFLGRSRSPHQVVRSTSTPRRPNGNSDIVGINLLPESIAGQRDPKLFRGDHPPIQTDNFNLGPEAGGASASRRASPYDFPRVFGSKPT